MRLLDGWRVALDAIEARMAHVDWDREAREDLSAREIRKRRWKRFLRRERRTLGRLLCSALDSLKRMCEDRLVRVRIGDGEAVTSFCGAFLEWQRIARPLVAYVRSPLHSDSFSWDPLADLTTVVACYGVIGNAGLDKPSGERDRLIAVVSELSPVLYGDSSTPEVEEARSLWETEGRASLGVIVQFLSSRGPADATEMSRLLDVDPTTEDLRILPLLESSDVFLNPLGVVPKGHREAFSKGLESAIAE